METSDLHFHVKLVSAPRTYTPCARTQSICTCARKCVRVTVDAHKHALVMGTALPASLRVALFIDVLLLCTRWSLCMEPGFFLFLCEAFSARYPPTRPQGLLPDATVHVPSPPSPLFCGLEAIVMPLL